MCRAVVQVEHGYGGPALARRRRRAARVASLGPFVFVRSPTTPRPETPNVALPKASSSTRLRTSGPVLTSRTAATRARWHTQPPGSSDLLGSRQIMQQSESVNGISGALLEACFAEDSCSPDISVCDDDISTSALGRKNRAHQRTSMHPFELQCGSAHGLSHRATRSSPDMILSLRRR
jgi:hypothetical protein